MLHPDSLQRSSANVPRRHRRVPLTLLREKKGKWKFAYWNEDGDTVKGVVMLSLPTEGISTLDNERPLVLRKIKTLAAELSAAIDKME